MTAKNINKVIYGGKTLIDLSADTVTAGGLLSGVTAHDKSGVPITGTCPFDVDSSGATAAVAEILEGKTAYARGAVLTGMMPNNGAVEKVISGKEQAVIIPQGYHGGGGKVVIDTAEQAKLVPGNVREGVTILGVEGAMSGSEDSKPQAKTVTPSAAEQAILPDEGYNCLSQVTVLPIPYAESENSAGGLTVTIAG